MQLTIHVSLSTDGQQQQFTLTSEATPPKEMTHGQYLDYWLALVRTEFAKVTSMVP